MKREAMVSDETTAAAAGNVPMLCVCVCVCVWVCVCVCV